MAGLRQLSSLTTQETQETMESPSSEVRVAPLVDNRLSTYHLCCSPFTKQLLVQGLWVECGTVLKEQV